MKEQHRGSRRVDTQGVSGPNISNVLRKQSSCQETEQILKSINNEKEKSTSRCSIAEHKEKKKEDKLFICREKTDFLKRTSIKKAAGFSRKNKNGSQKRKE